MSNTWLFVLTMLTLVVVLGLIYRPLGDYMAMVFSSKKDLKVERGFYRVIGVNSHSNQTWPVYLRSVLAFSALGVLLVYGVQRLQQFLPYSLGLPPVEQSLAWNTAISFVTNTNWQSYSPELTMGYTVQIVALVVQNFVSAAVGIAIAIALIRGLAARRSLTIGNFWVDLTRGTVRILLPLSVFAAIVLLVSGVVQNFDGFQHFTSIAGSSVTVPGGPVASQEAIKMLGTNGGGFFNANSAHPFENPNGWTNLFEIVLMLAIPFALTRTFGRMVGDLRQGYALLAVMGIFWVVSAALLTLLESIGHGTASQLAGGALEGKDTRFGIVDST
ncbi:MAG: potassium-transporting ATPase subunit KdpA, partial [Lacisediminihabitans sp.]